MRRRRLFLPLVKLWMDVPSYCNWNIPYPSNTLCPTVYWHFRLCHPSLFHLCGLYRLARMTFLWTASSFLELSWCTCQGGAGAVGGSWGICCPRWWIHYASPLLYFHVGCRSASGKRRKGGALWCPHRWLDVMYPSVQRRFYFISPVLHTPEAPCIVGSRYLLLWCPPLYWTTRTTVGWTACLVLMRKNQVMGCTPLWKGVGPPSVTVQSFQSAGRVSEVHRKCWPRSILYIASFYLAAIVCTVQESMRTLVIYAFSTDHFSLCMCATHCWTGSSLSQS